MPDREKVLVTGANGLLGSNITRRLLAAGYEPVLYLRKGSNRLALKSIECKIVEGELDDISCLQKAFEGCAYVIHCAAKTNQKGDFDDFMCINVICTECLMEMSKQYGIKRFIYISTANCFTAGSLDHPGNEASGFSPWLKHSGYAYSKYLAQQQVLDEFEKNGFPALVLAPTFLIGKGDAHISSGQLLLHGLKNRIVFYPPGGKSFVDAELAAEATVNALTKGIPGNCYMLAGENLSYKQFFKIIKNNFNKKAVLIRLPGFVISPLAQLFSFIQWIFPITLTFNKTNWRLLSLNNYFSNQKARTELGLKQTNTEKALKESYQWFKDNEYLH